MLEQELQVEKDLFFLLNGSESESLDYFFYLYSYKWTWLLFYACFLFVFIYKKNWKEIACLLLATALLILLCDQLASGFFKPLFQRLRPTHHPDFESYVKTVLNYRGGRYGFVSSHAANAFGFATFTALIFKNKLFSITIFLFALINSYSRIYLGVHFISDVVAGALLGVVCAIIVYKLYHFTRQKWLSTDRTKLKIPLFSRRESTFLCYVFFIQLIILLLFSNQLIMIQIKNIF
jgi:undecaprenyl-diphosphatase